MTELDQLTRDNLDAYTIRRLYRARNWTKADVILVKVDGRVLAVKDIRGRSLPVRLLFGRTLLQREFRILWRLREMEGVPRVYRMLDEDAFVMDYIEGENMGRLRAVSDATMQRLAHLFDELHRMGVAHGDPHASNILVTADGTPFLIDFSTAYIINADGATKGWRQRLWQELQKQDARRVAKMKQRFTSHLLTDEEKQLLSEPSRLYRFSKAMRRSWEWVTLKSWRKRWKKWRRQVRRSNGVME